MSEILNTTPNQSLKPSDKAEFPQSGSNEQCPENLDLYVLAGQSNMEGVGWLEREEEPHPDVWLFSSAGNWEIAQDPLHRVFENYTPDVLERMKIQDPRMANREALETAGRKLRLRPFQGVGPGLTFGKAMVEATGCPVGLVAAAHGGTSLDEWKPTVGDREGRTLYGAMMHRIHRVTQQEPAGSLKGILWYQGEADTLDEKTASTYAERFGLWIDAVRRDTGLSNLPVAIVQLGAYHGVNLREGAATNWSQVRLQQANLLGTRSRTAVTSAIDLPLDDSIHLAESGQRRLGRRLARRMLALQNAEGSRRGPHANRVEAMPVRSNGIAALRVIINDVTGSLNPPTGMSGFEVLEELPAPESFELRVLAADSEDAVLKTPEKLAVNQTAIRLLLNREPQLPCRVTYGRGLAPFCNVTDGQDDPLLAFDLPLNKTTNLESKSIPTSS